MNPADLIERLSGVGRAVPACRDLRRHRRKGLLDEHVTAHSPCGRRDRRIPRVARSYLRQCAWRYVRFARPSLRRRVVRRLLRGPPGEQRHARHAGSGSRTPADPMEGRVRGRYAARTVHPLDRDNDLCTAWSRGSNAHLERRGRRATRAACSGRRGRQRDKQGSATVAQREQLPD